MARAQKSSSVVLLLIFSGLFLTTMGSRVDGFFGGAAQGAGVMLVIFGAWTFGAAWRRPDGPDDTWLPSADGDR